MGDGTLTVKRTDILIPEFDAENHRFTVEGRPVPSVTQIIRSAGLMKTSGYNDFSRDRGKYVHLVCQFLDERDLDQSGLSLEMIPYLNAYKSFTSHLFPYFNSSGERADKWSLIEQPLADLKGRFCGIIDRAILRSLVLDIKTGAYQPWHRLQLAAYCSMMPEHWRIERWALYLSEDGNYSLRVFPIQEYPTDIAAFLSALNIHNWRSQHERTDTD